jgi:hypothetical protein
MRQYIETQRMLDGLKAMLRALDPNGDLDERAAWSSLLEAYRRVSRLNDL